MIHHREHRGRICRERARRRRGKGKFSLSFLSLFFALLSFLFFLRALSLLPSVLSVVNRVGPLSCPVVNRATPLSS